MKWIDVNIELPNRNERVILWHNRTCWSEGYLSFVREEKSYGEYGITLRKTIGWSIGNDTEHDYNGKPNVTHWCRIQPPIS